MPQSVLSSANCGKPSANIDEADGAANCSLNLSSIPQNQPKGRVLGRTSWGLA
jgi:hypothetical protein